MKEIKKIVVVALICVFAVCSAAADSSPAVNEPSSSYNHAQALIDWVNSAEGGFVSDKIELRRQNPDDPNSYFGAFAVRDIGEGEHVMTIPLERYIALTPDEKQDEPLYVENDETYNLTLAMEIYYGNVCRLAHKLLDAITEYRNAPDQSSHAPFLRYLEETQSKGQIPATYSPAGKMLLREILSTGMETNDAYSTLPPRHLVDWIDRHFVDTGCIQANDSNAYHAVAMTIQRGYDTAFIPVWDMVNHDNGRLNLGTNSIHSPEGIRVWATEPIAAGQELFATYNYCTECNDVGDDWGTPGIFRDFGFVEEDQWWPFEELGVYFGLVYSKFNSDNVKVTFDRDNSTGEAKYIPNSTSLDFFREQLVRLDGIEINTKTRGILANEAYMISEYYQSLKFALSSVIKATETALLGDGANAEL